MPDTKTRVTEGLKFKARIVAAIDDGTFAVVILAAGKSMNRLQAEDADGPVHIFYPPETLGSAETIALFEGATVNMHSLDDWFEHVPEGIDKSLLSGNTVGALEGVHYGEGALRGRLALHKGAVFAAGLLEQSVERVAAGGKPVVGLSIDARADIEFTAREGEDFAVVTAFGPDPTVDVVTSPAAGGAILSRIAASMQSDLAASNQGASTMPDDTKPQAGENKPAVAQKDPPIDEVALRASIKADILTDLKKADEDKVKAEKDIATKVRESESRLDAKLKESNLPEDGLALVREHFAGLHGKAPADEEFDDYIGGVRKLCTLGDKTGEVSLPTRLQGGEDIRRKVVEAELYDMFMQNSVEHTRLAARKALQESGGRPVHSLHKLLREAFHVDILDLDRSTGKERKRLTESLVTGDWTDIFGDVMNKALLDAYHANPWTDWRKVVRVKPLKDFMTQHTIRMGGYANLATVTQGANYPAMTSPGDEEHEWTPAKRGGTEDLTREMLLADDVMAVGRIPTSMAYAAARTIYEFVFDLLTIAGQPTMDYDATALFATSRTYNDNLGTTALAAAEIAVVWLAMQKFTDMSSAKREAIQPKFLLVPVDLAGTAMSIIKPLTEYAPGETQNAMFVRTFGLELIIVQHWANAKDHVYIADPALVPGFLLGFVGGQENPAMFVQDNANFGSVFDRDAITYKIRHEYGGSPVDHRAFYIEDVA